MPWRKLIEGKFGEEPKGWCSQVGREGYGFGVWKSIMKRWGIFKAKRWVMAEE